MSGGSLSSVRPRPRQRGHASTRASSGADIPRQPPADAAPRPARADAASTEPGRAAASPAGRSILRTSPSILDSLSGEDRLLVFGSSSRSRRAPRSSRRARRFGHRSSRSCSATSWSGPAHARRRRPGVSLRRGSRRCARRGVAVAGGAGSFLAEGRAALRGGLRRPHHDAGRGGRARGADRRRGARRSAALPEIPDQTDRLFVVDTRQIVRGAFPSTCWCEPTRHRSQGCDARRRRDFTPGTPAAQAAKAFERYDLVSAPVVDDRESWSAASPSTASWTISVTRPSSSR